MKAFIGTGLLCLVIVIFCTHHAITKFRTKETIQMIIGTVYLGMALVGLCFFIHCLTEIVRLLS